MAVPPHRPGVRRRSAVSGDGRDRYGADVTDDGERVWFVSVSGVVGEYDPATGNIENRGEQPDDTENFLDVAATGDAGEANVYVATEAGSVNYSFENGRCGTGNSASVGPGRCVDRHRRPRRPLRTRRQRGRERLRDR